MWQDIVIAIANVLFAYSLVYQVYLGFKHRKGFLSGQSTFLTTIGLYAMGISFLYLKLWFSASVATFNGTLWCILFIQALFYEKAQ